MWVIKLLSRMPWGGLRVLACGLAWFLFHFYRRSVVYYNLTQAFGPMDPKARRRLAKQFYLNFGYLIVELIKLISLTKADVQNRVVAHNIQVVHQHLQNQTPVLLMLCHTANWEWCNGALALHLLKPSHTQVRLPAFGLVRKFMTHIRENMFHSMTHESLRGFLQALKADPSSICGLHVDQVPARWKAYHVAQFFGRRERFFTSIESMPRLLNAAVVYLSYKRIGLGRFEMTAIPVCEPPYEPLIGKGLESPAITQKIAHLIEQDIRARPADWLWTHRRWKNPLPPLKTTAE